jgi:flagellar motor protein MotB
MREPEEIDPIDIWLAYSDLFSGVFVLVFGLLLFQLYPLGEGPDGEGNREFMERKQVQWDLTRTLFKDLLALEYKASVNDEATLKKRFDAKAGEFENVVVFTDSKYKEVVVIYQPQGEEQKITFGENALFDYKEPFLKKIKPAGLTLLQEIGSRILKAVSSNGEIRVFGHSDVKPMQSGDPIKANWVLSSERAIALVTVLLTDETIGKKLQEQGGTNKMVGYKQYRGDGETRLNAPPDRISAIGRGEFEPVGSVIGEKWDVREKKIYASSNDEPSMTKNRRIELIIKFISVPIQ